jgi:hypothetical protein
VAKAKKYFQDRNKPVVSVIKLHGSIAPSLDKSPFSGGGGKINLASVKPVVDKAFAPKNLESVLLSINSPGGSPAQCEAVSDYIEAKVKYGDTTFAHTTIWPETLAQRHLPRDICPETFAQNNICPEDICPEDICLERHLLRWTFAQMRPPRLRGRSHRVSVVYLCNNTSGREQGG